MEAPSRQLPTPPRREVHSTSSSSSSISGVQRDAAERLLVQFAQRLGTSSSSRGDNHHNNPLERSKSLVSLVSNGVNDDDVVLVLPSLAMRLSDSNAALPNIGETQGNNNNPQSTLSSLSGGPNQSFDAVGATTSSTSRPHMAASVLTAASDDAATVEHKAATSVSKQTSWTRSTVVYASHAVASNASDFFTKLTDSRLRSWTLLLLRHSLSTGNQESRSRLLNMLSATIQVDKTETSFKTLPLPDSAKGQPMDADVILPLLLEVVLHIRIQDKKEMITVRAPGTISAFLHHGQTLRKVLIRLDTGVLLSSMVDQARLVVFKAVANATKAPIPTPRHVASDDAVVSSNTATPTASAKAVAAASVDSETKLPAPKDQQLTTAGATPLLSSSTPSDAGAGVGSGVGVAPVSHLSGFRSALNLSVNTNTNHGTVLSPSLQKARSSALKLNSVLYGRGAGSSSTAGGGGGGGGGGSNGPSSLGQRRNRSIKWDSPLQIPKPEQLVHDSAPDAKKVRVAETTASKLKSFKSFGRPHAGVFGSGPRNATFGEYNRAHLWGRDGRLAHHPVPMQSMTAQSQLGMGPVAADKNATFDLSASLTRKSSSSSGGRSPTGSTSIPRSATILEKMLMKSGGM